MFTEDGSFDIAGMEAGIERHLATQGRALVVLNFPCHNPTGYTLTPEEWREVTDAINRAAAHGPRGLAHARVDAGGAPPM